ncbi:MAG: chemotaxis protein CheA [bacterium]|nr:chemotaxis protein CheA [bacterium]
MSDDDLELLQEFRTESLEHFEQVEPLFLEIEHVDAERRTEVVNTIFRAVHSVKGAAGFFGQTLIQELAHAGETLLMKVRDGELEYRPEMTDALLAALDTLQQLVEALPEEELELDITKHQEQLRAVAEDGGAPKPADATTESAEIVEAAEAAVPSETAEDSVEETAPDASPALADPMAQIPIDIVEEARRHGRKFFQIVPPYVDAPSLERVRTAAQALGSVISEQVEENGAFFVITSVLERPLLAEALGVDSEGIVQLNLPELEAVEPPAPTAEQPSAPAAAPTKSAPEKKAGSKEAASGDGADTIRVSVRLLDQLMNLAGELVLARNQLVSQLREVEDANLRTVLQNIDLVTSELQGNIMNTRMQPVGSVFKRFHRVVRDMSRKLGKKVELTLEGSDVDLDKSIIEMLGDPLTHLVRNGLDHGIEPPEDREAAGKNPTATLRLRAYHENGLVNIEIIDDGRGVDPEKMKSVAVGKGVLDEEATTRLSDQDAIMLMFAAGLSTAKEVTDVSGRGVGMDVVKSNIKKLGGKIDVDSEIGKGTTIRIRLPLTLAILPSLIVGVGNERFAVPQVNLIEVVSVHPEDEAGRIGTIRGAPALRHRGSLLPLVWLADVLDIPDVTRGWTPSGEDGSDQVTGLDSAVNILVLRVDQNQYGLVVDRIQDTEEIVVKPLAEMIKECRAFTGATIMGDGRVAMILDVNSVASQSQLQFDEPSASETVDDEAVQEQSNHQELLLFTSSADEQFAVELDQIVRLERIEQSQIETVGNKEFIQYRDRGLPIIRLENHIPVQSFQAAGEDMFVLIPRVNGMEVGILAREVVDTVRADVSLERHDSGNPTIAGRAVVGGRLTMFLDAGLLVDGLTGRAA